MIRLLFVTAVANIAKVHTPAAAMSLEAVDFEVFGTVQGVFFRKIWKFVQDRQNCLISVKRNISMGGKSTKQICPPGQKLVTIEAPLDVFDFEVFFFERDKLHFLKYTKEEADKLHVRGWCKNTKQGTVIGHVQGLPADVHQMMRWLRQTGSPNSIIDRANFTNTSEIPEYTFQNFEIRK